jgi:hypothetical protein
LTTPVVGGVPLIFGAVLLLVDVVTLIAKPWSDRLALPSVTQILMLGNTSMSLFVGVPDSVPVLELKEIQRGLLAIENLSVPPSASVAERLASAAEQLVSAAVATALPVVDTQLRDADMDMDIAAR